MLAHVHVSATARRLLSRARGTDLHGANNITQTAPASPILLPASPILFSCIASDHRQGPCIASENGSGGGAGAGAGSGVGVVLRAGACPGAGAALVLLLVARLVLLLVASALAVHTTARL